MNIDLALGTDGALPAAEFAAWRESGEVVWSEGAQGWLVLSYETVRSAISDVARFTQQGTAIAEVFGGEAMLVNDTPMHHTIRAVWAKQASAAAIETRASDIEALALTVLDGATDRLSAGESVDLIPLFREFVTQFIAESFEVPSDGLGVFRLWSELSAETPVLGVEEGSEAQRRHKAAREGVFDLLREMIANRKARLARGEVLSDYTSLMVAAEGRGGITPAIVIDNLFNFILGAFDTTERWLAHIVVRLCREPSEFEQLSADRTLISGYNEEVMRLDTVAQVLQRRVRGDHIELGGKAMRSGDAVFLFLGVANRDPAAFTDPDTFDMRRSGPGHVGFGFGFHHCLGINIARQEARAFVQALVDRPTRLTVVDCDYGSTWALWGPRRLLMRSA